MKISYLELNGYKRFKLSRIQRLIYQPVARQQLILGTNGSGKSSLLDELSPLPARPADFKSGGSKVIHLEHRGHEYVLRSTFQSTNRHSFVKDSIELNDGGTFQVQTRLVKEHLLYTEPLHNLLIGRIRFTELRPLERRDWITQLSETDWTYAMGVYQTLKSKVRDAQGALRHQQSRLTAESETFAKLDDISKVRDRVEILTSELNRLLIEIVPNTPKLGTLRSTLDAQFQGMVRQAQQMLSQAPDVVFNGVYSNLSQIQQDLQEAVQCSEIERLTLERISKEHSDLEALVKTAVGTQTSETVESLQERLTDLQQQLNRECGITRHFMLSNCQPMLADTLTAGSELQQIMSSLPDNSKGQFSRKRATELTEQMTLDQQQIDLTAQRLNRLHDRLSHIKEIHDSTCPRCQYVWKEGVDVNETHRLEAEQVSLQAHIEQLRLNVAARKQSLEEIDDYVTIWKRYVGLTQSYPRLRELFVYLQDGNYLTEHPNQNSHVLRQWEHDVRLGLRIEELQGQCEQLEQLIEAKRRFGESAVMVERLCDLEREITLTTQRLSQFSTRRRELDKLFTQASNFQSQMQLIQAQFTSFSDLLEQAIVSVKNTLLEEQVDKRHLELSELQRQLSDRSTLEGIISDLKRETEHLQQQHRALTLLTTAISPTEGIIADRLREAIFSIIDQMNTVIASVWSYELRVQECGFEGADLDYKFPVAVESPDDLVSDISKCSKGQMEIINIAFKLTAMLYLNMLDYPLFLDEPGEGFDEQHRDQIMSLIRSMLDSGHYSQLFMVSHIATSHGAFLDAQALVLDASNITVPGTFNEHAVME